MGKKKATLKTSLTAAAVTDENNGGGASQPLVPGSTLEDYFHAKKFDPKRDMQVSKHLLVGSPTNNAMAMEREDDKRSVGGMPAAVVPDVKSGTPEAQRASGSKNGTAGDSNIAERGEVVAKSSGARLPPPSEAKAKPSVARSGDARLDGDDDDDDRDGEESDAKDRSNLDDYEDDYESESESPSPDTSVAGMTLSDYLQAKETGNTQDDDSGDDGDCEHESSGAAAKKHHTIAAAGTKKKKKKHESVAAAPKKPVADASALAAAKKANMPALVSGMSLDHYLGALSGGGDGTGTGIGGGDPLDSGADSKSPTSKRKKSKAGKSGAKAMPKHAADSLGAAHDEHATPFQKRQTKKLRAKLKQQVGNGSALSVSKSILLAEPGALSLQTKAIPLSGAITVTSTKDKDKDRRRSYQQQLQQSPPPHQSQQVSQHPLPKLVAVSSSAHSLLSLSHKEQHQHSHGADSNDSNDDESEKLPPLAHY